MNTRTRLGAVVAAMVLVLAACGGGDDGSDATAPDAESTSDTDAGTDTSEGTTSTVVDGIDDDTTGDEPTTAGGGVILADLCSGGQPLNGAISLDDLVSFGILGSTDATVEGNAAYGASAYETFGFICNITDGGDFLTIGVDAGSAIWDIATEQGDGAVEQMGDWEVLLTGNWLSPLTMRVTDADGNQDSLYTTWTLADGSIPDAETLERVMRPMAEAIAARSTVDIPRS